MTPHRRLTRIDGYKKSGFSKKMQISPGQLGLIPPEQPLRPS
jgi:hypothetical protein